MIIIHRRDVPDYNDSPERGVPDDVSTVASRNDPLNESFAISLLLRLYIGVSTSPSDASSAILSFKSRFRLRFLDPGVVFRRKPFSGVSVTWYRQQQICHK